MIRAEQKSLYDQINMKNKWSKFPSICSLKSLEGGDEEPIIVEEKGDDKETPKVIDGYMKIGNKP